MITLPERSQIIVEGCVSLVKSWLDEDRATALGVQIVNETSSRWRGQLKYGKHGRFFDRGHTMSRFGDDGVTYSFKGKPKPMHAMTPSLIIIRDMLGEQLDWHANCVVVNTYEPDSGLYPHNDGKYIPQLGVNPTIVAVSFGCSRTFRLHPYDFTTNKYIKSLPNIDIELDNGDLLIMHGDCDSRFKHGIPEQPDRVGTRLSLTFRKHLQAT